MKTDPVALQLIANSLAYASEEMGLALRNTAYSPNIRERMDHSAAIFDPSGRLLAQAEHIPVHLGSLPWGVKKMIDECGRAGMRLEEGSMIVANNPYITGTHLNDLTLITPVHHGGRLVAVAANKAHHSDVGGQVPGSISMRARTLFEEGAVLGPLYLMRRGEFVKESLNAISRESMTPRERLGDVRAQVAANVTGSRRVTNLIVRYGTKAFELAAEKSFRHSKSMMLKRLRKIKSGSYNATEVLEGPQGETITLRASVKVSRNAIMVDYSGTDKQVDYPLNAVFGVTISGVYFVIRTLTGDDIPANHGTFLPIRITAAEGTVLNPTYPHPVGGGNVETSQRNADLLYRALSKAAPGLVPAASGGSMNNVMVGGVHKGVPWAFYETIGVGMGGRRGMDGIDGIQCNMTNTMNTPIEEIERTFPIMMTRYEFRPNSCGAGEFRGGSGIVRRFRMTAGRTIFTVLADRENHSPWGLAGGLPGKTTEVTLWRGRQGSRLPAKSTITIGAGDEVEIRTAGGGGYGDPVRRTRAKIREDLKNGLITSAEARKNYGNKLP